MTFVARYVQNEFGAPLEPRPIAASCVYLLSVLIIAYSNHENRRVGNRYNIIYRKHDDV